MKAGLGNGASLVRLALPIGNPDSDLLLPPLPIGQPHVALQRLAGGVARKIGHDHHALNPLIAGCDAGVDPVAQLFRRRRRPDMQDHRDRAVWLGQQVPLVLSIFTEKD